MNYCRSCGSKMKVKKMTKAFDRDSGKFIGWWEKLVCPKWWRFHTYDLHFRKLVK